jgi:hypothetical protein
MKLYAYERDEHNDRWFGTRSEAQKFAKADVPAVYRPSIKVHERNVQTDKAGVLRILKGEPIYETVHSWTMSSRGALAEISL